MNLVRYEQDTDGVVTRTLDSPETRNALSDELIEELIAALKRARNDVDTRVVVITSSHERVFSAGGNLKAFAGDTSTIDKYAGLNRFPRLSKLIGGLGKPVICAANGDVLAGAFGLALACDLVIAKDGVRFGCPEINVGVLKVSLADVYAIFAYYPRHRGEVEDYLAEQERLGAELQAHIEAIDPPNGPRARLLARLDK